MRKTLLMTAAALAAGIISTQAQVYSQNVVGYYNVSIPGKVGSTGFYPVANQFTVGVSNGLSEMFAGGGLESDPNFGTNSLVYIWLPGSSVYATYSYLSAADSAADSLGGLAGFYDGSGNFQSPIIPPGSSVFIQNQAPGGLTVPIVGTVPQGTNLITLLGSAAGTLNLVCSPIPVSTNIASSVINFTGTSDPNFGYNDQILLWNAVTGVFTQYSYLSAADSTADSLGGLAGFYDGSGNYQAVAPLVGNGFFIEHFGPSFNGTSETWTNTFTVQ